MKDLKRIIVRDFDSTYQAKLWIESIEKDNSENTLNKHNLNIQNTMKGILRTTFLLTD